MGAWLPGPTLLGPTVPDQQPIVVSTALQVLELPTAPTDMVVASDGGLVLVWNDAGGTVAAKLDRDNSMMWTKTIVPLPSRVFVNVLLAGQDGVVYFGGWGGLEEPATEPFAGGSADAILGKLTADGDVEWMRQWGTTQLESITTLVLAGDGGVFGTAQCSELLPGAPPENLYGDAFFRYDAAGARSFLRQHSPHDPENLRIDGDRDGIFLDPSGAGRIFSSGTLQQRTVDATGLATATSEPPAPPSGPRVNGAIRRVPGNQLLAYTHARKSAGSRTFPALAGFDLDGTLKWYRLAEIESSVIDQTAGTVWTGEWIPPGYGDTMVVGPDAIYVSGSYLSEYENGPTEQVFAEVVAKYDFTGERLWFRLFKLPAQNSGTWVAHRLVLDLEGSPLLFLGEGGVSPFIVRLRPEDGTIVEP
jgi:hypothetical protein